MFRILFLACLSLTSFVAAQGEAKRPVPPADPQQVTGRAGTLVTLFDAIQARRTELEDLRGQPVADLDETERAERQAEIRRLEAELQGLRADFQSVATGVDVGVFEASEPTRPKLADEIDTLLRPLLAELREATEDPRQIEHLRAEVSRHAQRRQIAEKAIEGLSSATNLEVRDEVVARLRELAGEWERRLVDARNRELIAEHQLEARLNARKSLWESTSNLFGTFFRTRGLNLLLAILAFVGVFFSLRFATRRASRWTRRKSGSPRAQFHVKLFVVVLHGAIAVAATVAALLVLYASGDWVLLGLALLFLLGLGWASKTALPMFFEQVRLLLNVGSVREGERILIDGLPWRVDRINVYTRLVNPELTGGMLRLPIKQLIGLYSRPIGDHEQWFPCSDGDWVVLSDETFGRVVAQTPDMVHVVQLGGARVTYQTSEFLALNPKNLSANFRISLTFGVDYAHQPICTTEIPAKMHAAVESRLHERIGEDGLVNLTVEFKEAGASSLDYSILVDVRGEHASKYQSLKRLVQTALVDACNDNDWVIPFTQITLHQAG